jgi:hypothetical protein
MSCAAARLASAGKSSQPRKCTRMFLNSSGQNGNPSLGRSQAGDVSAPATEAGSSTMKVLPRPAALRTLTWPQCSSTS